MNINQVPLISFMYEDLSIYVYDCGPQKHLYVGDNLIDTFHDEGSISYVNFLEELNLDMFTNQDLIKKVLVYKFSMYYGDGYYTNADVWGFLYGEEYAAEIGKVTKLLTRQYHYADNFRVAKVGDDAETELYNKARKNGCCGYHDEEYQIMFQTFKIGCNYGH